MSGLVSTSVQAFRTRAMRMETGPEAVRRGDDAMNRYAAGDDGAFPELYAVVVPLLTRYLGRRLREKAALPDLVQETLLRLHRARRSFVPGSPVMPWVLTIARHQLIDWKRVSMREEAVQSDPLYRSADQATFGAFPSGEEVVAAREVVECLDRALTAVSEPQRAALRLVKGKGLSVAKAAAALGTTATGVKLRTHRACRILRASLGVTGAHPEIAARSRELQLRTRPGAGVPVVRSEPMFRE
jgi:RNA polymerase sigma-70 factor (ECF subfamily)